MTMLLLVASLSMAGVQAPAASAPAPAVKTKRVCHVEEAVIGSLTPKRVCVTIPQQAAPAPATPAQEADRDKQPQPPSASGISN
jgi:hypothetical protein